MPKPKLKRASCVLCACKHIAQARVLKMESLKGYDRHYFYCLGHLAEAEDELLDKHPELAEGVRGFRKRLEDDATFDIPWAALIEAVYVQGDAHETALLRELEADFDSMTIEELRQHWSVPLDAEESTGR